MNFLKVSGHDDLVRDTTSLAIVNTNVSAYTDYVNRRNAIQDEKQLIAQQSQEINNLKSELSDIKQMLTKLLKAR
jgi:cell division protein FtsL